MSFYDSAVSKLHPSFHQPHKMLDFEPPGYIFDVFSVSLEHNNLVGNEGAIAGELIC